MTWSNTKKSEHKLLRTGVDFKNKPVLPVDPYFLGVLLGDGCLRNRVAITNTEPNIKRVIRKQAKAWGLEIKPDGEVGDSSTSYVLSSGRGGTNPLREKLIELGLFNTTSGTKFIPQEYKTAPAKSRQQILAGLLDTDGGLGNNCYEFVSKSRRLANDVAFVARSLGLSVNRVNKCKKASQNGTVGTYYRLLISGQVNSIPVKIISKIASPRKQPKDPLRTGFNIENVRGLRDYYGFQLDKDQRYLMGDFTITHNSGKTEMALQACEEEGATCLYWNLSVTERPDLQGVPVVDGLFARYAAPEKLPFMDVRSKMVRDAADYMGKVDAMVGSNLGALADRYDQQQEAYVIRRALEFVEDPTTKEKMEQYLVKLDETLVDLRCAPIVILFDEVEKAPVECLQPLLELLQYRTINGRPLCIKSCILTGNLPDEHTHSEPLSHAITNRDLVYQLEPNFDVWLQWALKHDIHPLITGFLAYEENQEFFLKRPKNNQIYNYAYPTPRAWTDASYLIQCFEQQFEKWGPMIGMGSGRRVKAKDGSSHELDAEAIFRGQLLASKVGVEAATRLQVWADYYQKLNPIITMAFEGQNPDISARSVDEKLVCLIGASARFVAFARKHEDIPVVHAQAARVFGWMKDQDIDLRIAALRGTCDKDLFAERKLDEFPLTHEIWLNIVKTVRGDYDNEIEKEDKEDDEEDKDKDKDEQAA
jgi:hypothetical protein